MSTTLIVGLAILLFLVLILVETPIGLALALAGAAGIVLLRDADIASSTLSSVPYSSSAKYSLFVIPMFVLLGALVANAGIAGEIYAAANRAVGRLPGGLASTAVLATTIFSGISGSSAADVATMGRVSVGEMRRHGYAADHAAAVVAAAGTFAVLVPPSIVLVIYGIVADVSVADLLLAGIVPGVLSAVALIAFITVRAIVRPAATAAAPGATPTETTEAGGDPPAGGLLGVVYAAVLFAIVAGGIYTGIFTATEAGAIGAFAALVLVLADPRARRRGLLRLLGVSIRETATITSMIFLLLIGGAVFTFFVASAGVPSDIADWILDLPVSAHVVVALFLLALIPLGMLLDGLSILLLTVPIAAPVIDQLGFDPVWFGVLTVKMIEIGLITPPVGINVFIISGLVDDAPVERVFRRVLPFVVLDLAITAALFAFPGIVTWLPELASQ